MTKGPPECIDCVGHCLVAVLLVSTGTSAQTFTDRWSAAGFRPEEATEGVALGDQDGDGLPDVFITSTLIDNPIPFFPDFGGPDRLYRNQGAGLFADRAPALGLADPGQGQGAAWADFDNDGLLDLYVVRGLQQAIAQGHLLYRQTATGFDSSPSGQVNAAGAGRSVCWADFDNDGFVDVFATNGLDSTDLLPDARTHLFRNRRDGTFEDVAAAVGVGDTRNGCGCAWSDYDNDGDVDLYVANHGVEDPVLGFSDPQPNALYRNQLVETGVATFVDVAVAAGVDAMEPLVPGQPGASASFGCAFADFNNDGWMDLFVTNGFAGLVPLPTPNRLYVNNGDGTFSDRSLGVIDLDFDESSFGVTWADFDNDGDIDAFVANAEVPLIATATNDLLVNGGWPFYLLTNREAGSGIDVHEFAGAAASADFDGDGWMDIYSSNGIPGIQLVVGRADNLFMNDGGTNHWLHLDLVGVVSNRSAIGARITLEAGVLPRQTREIAAGSGYQSMDDLRVEFGLRTRTVADKVTIRWPSGCVQELRDVAADQVLEVVESCTDFIHRDAYRVPAAGRPLPAYAPAPVVAPFTWSDPQAVLGDGRTLFYQHSGAVDLRVRKSGGTVALTW